MKFKIHAKEVRRAAKSKNLKIRDGLTISKDEWTDYGEACPIGAIYCKEKDIDIYDDDAVWEADNKALDWGKKKYGKYYVDGFVEGFDASNFDSLDYALECHDELNSKQRKSFINGYRNGKLLARYLLND